MKVEIATRRKINADKAVVMLQERQNLRIELTTLSKWNHG
jgi:hypothetical protein